jgi:predicted transposase/invertase (TIGR01784 family)
LLAENPEVKKAVAELMTLSEDERARMLAESRDKMRWDIESGKREAKERGLEKVTRKALAEKIPLDMIQKLTGLSIEKIQALTR